MEFLDELSKHLKYRTIDSVIGKRITITSLETLGQDLKEFFNNEIPYLGKIENSAQQFSDGLPWFYLPFMKYRVLDLTFIPDRLTEKTDCPSADPSIISMLGFSDDDESWRIMPFRLLLAGTLKQEATSTSNHHPFFGTRTYPV